MQPIAESGVFFVLLVVVGVFLPWSGGDSLVHVCSDISGIKILLLSCLTLTRK